MGKNDVSVDFYDKHEVTLSKNCFLLYPAEPTQVIEEIWVLVPKISGCEIYLRQHRFDWHYWRNGMVEQPKKLKALTENPKSYCLKGTLEQVMASLKEFGIEEQHVEVYNTELSGAIRG